MKTLVSIPHHEYHSQVREHVEEKLQHLARFFDRIISMRALLERQAEEHRVELVANVGQGVTLVVDARGDVVLLAVRLAVETRQRRRHTGVV